MKKILIVDDSKFMVHLLCDKLETIIEESTIYSATSREDALKLCEKIENFHIALLDLNLGDDEGTLVDEIIERGIPVVVLTGDMTEEVKNRLINKDIVDFVQKKDPQSISYAVNRIKRVLSFYDKKVLIIDDSKVHREQMREFLKPLHVKVLCANDGKEALNIIKDKKIDLAICDYEMPNMKGDEFILKAREDYKKDKLGILAISASDDEMMATKFLKFGANDFLQKPYKGVELTTKVNAILELLDLFEEIRQASNIDYLTGIYNRRYFEHKAKEMLKNSKSNILFALIDIDKFKNINDTYGHDVGDEAIVFLVEHMKKAFKDKCLLARVGGEEFYLFGYSTGFEEDEKSLNAFRKKIGQTSLNIGKVSINMTISIGAYSGNVNTIKKLTKIVDNNLYKAKNSGRNRVFLTQI